VSGGGQHGIARPVSGPVFTGHVEPMSQQRGNPQNRAEPRARQDAHQQARYDARDGLRQQPRHVPDHISHDETHQNPHDGPRYDSYYQDQRHDPRRDAQYDRAPDQDRHDEPAKPAQRARDTGRRQQARPQPQDGGARAHPEAHGYLAAHGVERSFVGRKVVKGVSLYVRRGEAVGLLGPNGAGKTTVFYMITGLITADRGRIELDGHDVTALPMYQRARLGIGYLPQEASIFRGLNVEQNIRAVLEIVEPSKKRREYDLDALLEEFNIARLRKTPTIALSGGERRRVEIARALATRPNYMLLDEPFAGIDPIAVGDIQALVRHLTQRGIGVLITDHNVRETLGLTDRAYIIYSGEVLMEGRAEDIVNNPDVRRLYLGEDFSM
jgi:lipopolysaccharide export system ATP-binding protein